MKRRRHLLGRSYVGMLAVGLAFCTPAVAAAAERPQPCWRAVVDDWANGGINRQHSLRCYRSALHNLPSDIRTYTTAEDDIRRAVLDAIRDVRSSVRDASSPSVTRSRATSRDTATPRAPSRSLQGRSVSGTRTASSAAPAGATSPPRRAVVAAALALVLLLGAGIGRYHASRRAGPQAH